MRSWDVLESSRVVLDFLDFLVFLTFRFLDFFFFFFLSSESESEDELEEEEEEEEEGCILSVVYFQYYLANSSFRDA